MNNPLNKFNSYYKYDPDGSGDIIVDLGRDQEPEKTRIPRINVILFILTVISTVYAGAFYLEGKNVFSNPLDIIYGIPFSFSIMFILGAHEMGHYLMCRKHGIPATLPYFIPAPHMIGTFGAIIKIKGMMKNRKDLVDVGAAGPIAGILASIPVLIIGIYLSDFRPLPTAAALNFGEPLLYKFIAYIVKGTAPSGQDLYLSSVGLAGWVGLLVTTLNLIPVGQLDGGHILYGVTPRLHGQISKLFALALIPLGFFFWQGWLLWAIILLILKFRHPSPKYAHVPLDTKRKVIAFIALVIFLLTFTHNPIYIQ